VFTEAIHIDHRDAMYLLQQLRWLSEWVSSGNCKIPSIYPFLRGISGIAELRLKDTSKVTYAQGMAAYSSKITL
jgi:hypothetical protein